MARPDFCSDAPRPIKLNLLLVPPSSDQDKAQTTTYIGARYAQEKARQQINETNKSISTHPKEDTKKKKTQMMFSRTLPHIILVFFFLLFALQQPHQVDAGDPNKCNVCVSVVKEVTPFMLQDVPLAELKKLADFVCSQVTTPDCRKGSGCDELCGGMVDEFFPEIVRIMRGFQQDPLKACVKVCDVPPQPFPQDFPATNCSDRSGEEDFPAWKRQQGTGNWLLLSDFHLDLDYEEGAEADCGLPVCCRSDQQDNKNVTKPASKWGTMGCDTPMRVFQAAMDKIEDLSGELDFIVYLGDSPSHDIWRQSREDNEHVENTVLRALKERFGQRMPVFGSLGNHGMFPVNLFIGPEADAWLYKGVAGEMFLPGDAQRSFLYGGYYTARLRPGLRLVSLNTNYFMTADWQLILNSTDISSQFAWLANVLHQSQRAGERVIIVGHCHSAGWESRFAREGLEPLLLKYKDTVLSLYFGHHHTNFFSVLVDENTQPLLASLSTGAFNPFSKVNPSMKLFTYDRSSFAMSDYQQWYLDLNQTNHADEPIWTKFQAKEYFGIPASADVSDAQTWFKVARQLQNEDMPDSLLREKYLTQMFSGIYPRPNYEPGNGTWCILTSFAPGECA